MATLVLAFASNELPSKRRVSVIYRDLGECYQSLLWCSKEYVFQYYACDSDEDSVQLIQYPNHNYRMGLKNLENFLLICAPVSDLDQAAVL